MARTRSTRAHQQVLEAALKLFARQGNDATSMDAIAATSGVSKATIYKHWRDKDALCLEGLDYLHGHDLLATPPNTGELRYDLIAALNRQTPTHRSGLHRAIAPHLASYAARNPAFAKAWRARVTRPAQIEVLQLLKDAVAGGQLASDLNLDAAVTMLLGPMMYRHVFSLQGRRLPDNLAELVVDAFLRAHSLPRPAGKQLEMGG